MWRLTGQQIAGAAAEVDGAPAPTGAKGPSEGGSEDVRGPHAALAVKLQVSCKAVHAHKVPRFLTALLWHTYATCHNSSSLFPCCLRDFALQSFISHVWLYHAKATGTASTA